jgi:Fimbrial assembly protein (PilN)
MGDGVGAGAQADSQSRGGGGGMKEIDFLPIQFHKTLIKRHRTRRNVWFCLALGTSLAMLHGVGVTRIRSAQASLDSIRISDGERLARRMKLRDLQAKRETLAQRAGLISQLDDNAPLDVVLSEITKLMSESMALKKISLETLKPAKPEGKDKNEPMAESKKSDPLLDRGNTEMALSAVAANDVEVGIFFGRLSSSPLFENVRLSFSRELEQSGRAMREFELKFSVKRVVFGSPNRVALGDPEPAK